MERGEVGWLSDCGEGEKQLVGTSGRGEKAKSLQCGLPQGNLF